MIALSSTSISQFWLRVDTMREPFFKKSHKGWYVRVGKQDVFLAKTQEAAWQEYRKLMAYSASTGEDATVSGVLIAYLEELRPTVSAARYIKVSRYARGFIEWIGDFREASSLNRSDILNWLSEDKSKENGKPRHWSVAAKRDAGQVIRSAFRWALNEGMVSKNPAANLRLQQPEPRTHTIDYATHKQLVLDAMQSDKSRSVALYLIASRCGARPQQIREVRKENLFYNGQAWVFHRHKTKGKTAKPLVVPLSPCLQTISRVLASCREKELFLNDRGTRWTKDSVSLRIRRMRERLGIKGLVAYSYRHTFATDALLSGTPIATVAAMLGHTDTKMVAQVYGHLDQHTWHLVQAAGQTAKHRLENR
jgi:integrase